MRALTPIALTVGVPATIALQNYEAYAVLYNESPLNLLVATALGMRTLPAWTGDLFTLSTHGGGGVLSVIPSAIITQANPPASSLTGDIFYDTERPQGLFPISLARQVSVGNQVSTTTSQSVINDGNPAPTEVVEGTPSGASASQLKINNDGSAILGGGNVALSNAGIFTALPADALPVAAIAAGTLDTDVVVPVANLAAGTLPAGVAVPEGNVGSGYPAAHLGAGTVAAGVVVPGANVSGAVANAQTTDTVDNATMSESAPIARADQALAQIGFGLNGSAQTGINAYEKNVTIGGQNNTQAMNAYFNGTADLFITSAAALQWQVFSGGVRLRWSTNATPTAGASVTWSPWTTLYDNNANFLLPVPGANVTGTVASATSATNATKLNSNLTASDDGAQAHVVPVAASRGTSLDYTDTGGAAHAGVNLTSNGLFWAATGEGFKVSSKFSGTGSGTFTHGLTRTPAWVGITTTEANSTETVGVDTIGGSTVHVNQGQAGWPWIGLATV